MLLKLRALLKPVEVSLTYLNKL